MAWLACLGWVLRVLRGRFECIPVMVQAVGLRGKGLVSDSVWYLLSSCPVDGRITVC